MIRTIDAEQLVMREIGEFVIAISEGKVHCLREMLEYIFKISDPISCDIAVYDPPLVNSSVTPYKNRGVWHGVQEKTLKGLNHHGYPKFPIGEYLKLHNQNKIPFEDRLEIMMDQKNVSNNTIDIILPKKKFKSRALLAINIPIKLPLKNPDCRCCFILFAPISVKSAADPNKKPDINLLVADLVKTWLAWLNFERSSLHEKLFNTLEKTDKSIDDIFVSLIRLAPLHLVISFINQRLILNKNIDITEDELIQWLRSKINKIIDLDKKECWHGCMQGPWPPCHRGKKADRELAKILLHFCPWTSGELTACNSIPEALIGDWRKVVRNRLWGGNQYSEYQGVDPKYLNENSLTLLFGAEFIYADSKHPYLNDYTTSKERGHYLAYVGRAFHHQLAKTPLDWKTIEGMVWMIAEFGHKHLKIDPRLDIASHLLQAARAEPALHAMQAYYRDHFFHAIEVCFLGHLLLLTKDSSGTFLWKHVAKSLRRARKLKKWSKDSSDPITNKFKSIEDVLQLWYVTALFHDVGYTIQIFTALQKMLEFYHHPEEMKEFKANLDQSLQKLSKTIMESGLKDILELANEDNPGSDHGVIASSHLKNLLSSLRKDKQAGNYDPAIRAIGVHNSRRATVDFQSEPLGFLLILCDTIQEWNRPHLRYATAPSMLLSRLMGKEKEYQNTTGPLDSVSMNINRSDKPNPRPKFKIVGRSLDILLTYDEQILKDSGVFNLWVDSSCNLQRLRLNALPFNIKLTFKTPRYQASGHKPESQMDRLRDAAAETHMHFLQDWLPSINKKDGKKANKTNAISLQKNANYDILTLDLRRLTRVKTIAGNINQFRDHLKNWNRWSEDRDFEGDYTPMVPGK